jgi:hypothetical protein
MAQQVEYIAIQVSAGAVVGISPSSPQTQSAFNVNVRHEIGTVVNKLAEYEYRLIDGHVPTGDLHPGGANYIVFMQREK